MAQIRSGSTRSGWLSKLRAEELIILLLYPITCILGQLVYSTGPPSSYFSNKKNILNVVFVKNGWFWTSVAAILLLLARLKFSYDKRSLDVSHGNSYQGVSRQEGNESNQAAEILSVQPELQGQDSIQQEPHEGGISITKAKKQSATVDIVKSFVLRYTIATLWFILFTQWCFGVPLMDKIFVLTGGGCQGQDSAPSSSLCRNVGGKWIGGYDPSGHSFLLVLSSLYLWFELLPLLQVERKTISINIKLVLGLLVIWWWMFLMTSMYFHSFAEKVGGMLPAYLICFIYLDLRN